MALKVAQSQKQWRREGGEGGHAPRAALCRGRHLEGRQNMNAEIWPLLANWHVHCRQWYFIYTPNTLPVLGLQLSVPHDLTQSSVYTKKIADWSFTCCKTLQDPYCTVTVLLAIV